MRANGHGSYYCALLVAAHVHNANSGCTHRGTHQGARVGAREGARVRASAHAHKRARATNRTRQVLFLEVASGPGRDQLDAVAALAVEHFRAAGLKHEDGKPITPHITVAKTSRLLGHGGGGKRRRGGGRGGTCEDARGAGWCAGASLPRRALDGQLLVHAPRSWRFIGRYLQHEPPARALQCLSLPYNPLTLLLTRSPRAHAGGVHQAKLPKIPWVRIAGVGQVPAAASRAWGRCHALVRACAVAGDGRVLTLWTCRAVERAVDVIPALAQDRGSTWNSDRRSSARGHSSLPAAGSPARPRT